MTGELDQAGLVWFLSFLTAHIRAVSGQEEWGGTRCETLGQLKTKTGANCLLDKRPAVTPKSMNSLMTLRFNSHFILLLKKNNHFNLN